MPRHSCELGMAGPRALRPAGPGARLTLFARMSILPNRLKERSRAWSYRASRNGD